MTSYYEVDMNAFHADTDHPQIEQEVIPPGEPGRLTEAAEFDYADLEPNDRAVAIEAAANIRLHGRQAAESIVAIGEELVRVKAVLPHGAWLPWLDAEFGWKERIAQNFVQCRQLSKSQNLRILILGR